MGKIVLISSSLSKNSRSAKLIKFTANRLKELGNEIQIIDLREREIPFCDGRKLADYSTGIQDLYDDIKSTDSIIFGFPIYCYSISGVLKNFLDIFSYAMKEKSFGVCASAGSKMSFLAIADLYKIMQFQSNAKGVMPAVLVDYEDFKDNIPTEPIKERIDHMLESLTKEKNRH